MGTIESVSPDFNGMSAEAFTTGLSIREQLGELSTEQQVEALIAVLRAAELNLHDDNDLRPEDIRNFATEIREISDILERYVVRLENQSQPQILSSEYDQQS